jgi:hypothetical protein
MNERREANRQLQFTFREGRVCNHIDLLSDLAIPCGAVDLRGALSRVFNSTPVVDRVLTLSLT